MNPDLRLGQRPSSVPPKIGLEVELEAVPRAAARARQALAVFAESLPAEVYTNLRTVVTELVTNSVKYGPAKGVAVSVTLAADGTICGDVFDAGRGGVEPRPGADPASGGIGLLVVDALTRSWGVHPNSSHVWFELDASALR